MEQIRVGLTNGKTSFWDPNTKAYITLSEPVQKISFDEEHKDIANHLSRICHALFASNPSLKLYEGKIPEKAIEAWKAKMNLSGLNIAKNRADKLQSQSAQVVTADAKKSEEVIIKASSPELKEIEQVPAVEEKEQAPLEEVEQAPAKNSKKKTADK